MRGYDNNDEYGDAGFSFVLDHMAFSLIRYGDVAYACLLVLSFNSILI